MSKVRIALVGVLALLTIVVFSYGSALAAGIRVVPSNQRVLPGENFYLDVVAEGIPAEGLGGVQFRLNVSVPGGTVSGVTDLGQAGASEVAVATPLLVSPATATRSGIGNFFWNGRGVNGILVMDNEPLVNGSALYTFAHTNGATAPSGSGSVARFMVRVSPGVNAKEIIVGLTDVMLLDGGPAYPLDYNTGATVQIGCFTRMPDLLGLSLSEAAGRLAQSQLVLGTTYEIDNTGGTRSLNAVLEQSSPAGSELLCEAPVNLAVNVAPADVTGAGATDKFGDDGGAVVLAWASSASSDTAGYRVYLASALIKDIQIPAATGTEIGGLAIGVTSQLRVAAYDSFGNESLGITIPATPIDDVPPVVIIGGVTEGAYYKSEVTPQVSSSDTNMAAESITLNGAPYALTPIAADGAYTLTVSATDRFSNQTTKSVHFTIDQTPPAITVANVSNGGFYNIDVAPAVTVTDTNLKASSLTMNEQPYASGTPVTSEGSFTLVVSAEDLSGNSATQSVSFIIDKTPPVSSADIGLPKYVNNGVFYISGLTPLGLTAQDNGIAPSGVAGIDYGFDSAQTLGAYSAPVTLAGLADGDHTVSYGSYDKATNRENAHVLAVTLDNSPPVTSLTLAGPSHLAGGAYAATSGTTFNLQATDLFSGIARTEYRLDGGQWISFAPFAISTEGTHSIEYRSTDNLDNTENLKLQAALIDNTPPVTAITVGTPQYASPDGILYIQGSTPLTLAATDSASGVQSTEYRIDAGDWTTYQGAFTVPAAAIHTVEYRSIDVVGNPEQVKTLIVVVDNRPPLTEISVGTPKHAEMGLFVRSTTPFTLTATDDLSGVVLTEYRIDDGGWTTYAAFTVQAQGTHLIRYRSIDQVGNRELEKTLTVIVDDTPPVSAISIGNPKFQGSAALFATSVTTFSITATDAGSGVERIEYRIDGGAWTLHAPFTLSGEGPHTIDYRVFDLVGNLEAFRTLFVTVDNTSPASAITLGTPRFTAPDGTIYTSSATNYTVTATDNLSGISSTEYRNDAGAWTAYAPFAIAAEGSHAIGFRSIDNVTNAETEKSVNVIVDNAPPATAISVGTPKHEEAGKQYVTGSIAFTLSATDNLSGVARTEYRIDGGAWIVYAPFTIAAEGEHVIAFRSADNVGNQEAEKTIVVTVDNTPPSTAITAGAPKFEAGGKLFATSATQFTLAAVDTLSGVARTVYRIDGGQWLQYAPFAIAAEGEHVIAFRSADNVGNQEAEKTIVVTVDNTPPSTAITAGAPKFEAGGKLFATSATPFTLAAADNLSGVAKTEYRIDGGQWLPYGPFVIAAEGEHVIGFRSADNVGNQETEKTIAVVVDNTPPQTTVTVGTPKSEGGGKLFATSATQFTLAAADTLSGVAKTEYRIDGGQWFPYAPFAIATEGEHVIGFRSADNLINQEIEKVLSVVVDNTTPVSTISAGSPQYSANGDLYISGRTELTISAADSASGVKASEYGIDQAAFGDYAGPFNLAALPDGGHSVAYRSTDNLGNQETAKQLDVILDKTPPQTVIAASDSLVTGAVNTVSPKTTITMAATDNLAGVKEIWYRIDGGQWQLFSDGFNLEGLKAGAHTISYSACDNVGNDEVERTITVRLILVEVVKDIPPEPVVLVGAWTDNLNTVTKRGDIDALSSMLLSAGVSYHVSADGEDFKRGLRSGRYNTYILVDYKDDKLGAELREAVNYGDSLIFIKTRPGADPALDEVFGAKFTGKTTSDNLTVNLTESPLGQAGTMQSSGKSVVGTVIADTASVLGYVEDKRTRYPSIVFNGYGSGKTLLYTFDLLSSVDKERVAGLISSSLTLLQPGQHKVRALDSVPIRISIASSTEPLGLQVTETIPVGTSADSITPQGVATDTAITWLQDLGASTKAEFGYYLNLPDAKGEYTATTDVGYANLGDYRLYETAKLTLSVQNDSADLLRGVIADLDAIPAAGSGDIVILTDAVSKLSLVTVNPFDGKEAEKGVEAVTAVTKMIRGLSADTTDIRLKLDELLKILERKWYLISLLELPD